MIIRSPTGLYKSALPVNPSDGGNVTFTISNSDPPRAGLLFPKLPDGIELRTRTVLPVDPAVQRAALGELVYTVSEAGRAIVGNNARQLQIGQILEFTNTIPQSLDPMLVGSTTEIQHNSDTLDYVGLGISDKQVEGVNSAAAAAYDALMGQLNTSKRQRADAEQTINTLQKQINDAQRAINALQIVINTTSAVDQGIKDTLALLQRNLASYNKAMTVAIAAADAAATQAATVLNAMRSLATVVQ